MVQSENLAGTRHCIELGSQVEWCEYFWRSMTTNHLLRREKSCDPEERFIVPSRNRPGRFKDGAKTERWVENFVLPIVRPESIW